MTCTSVLCCRFPSTLRGCAIEDCVSAGPKGHQEILSITADHLNREAEREHNLNAESSKSRHEKGSDIHSNETSLWHRQNLLSLLFCPDTVCLLYLQKAVAALGCALQTLHAGVMQWLMSVPQPRVPRGFLGVSI